MCRKPLFNGVEVHEALITRGDVQGLPFAKRMQIFCAQNCVEVHANDCHMRAQFYPRAKRFVAKYLIYWNGEQAILDFLHYMNDIGVTKAKEVEREIECWKPSLAQLA